MFNQKKNVLNHIAVILDGNGRWAKKRGLSRAEGHKAGVENLREVIYQCSELEIKYLTLYVFSTENWNRPISEVTNLMNILDKYMELELDTLYKEGVRLNVIGDLTKLPKKTIKLINNAIEFTKNNKRLVLTLALNYGSRYEMIRAVKNICKDVLNGKIDIKNIDDKKFSTYLYTNDIPDPDLLIRTSGEYRLSNFLLWQCAYTEFWYTDVLWPDFGKEDLMKAIESFCNRKRRFGKVNDES